MKSFCSPYEESKALADKVAHEAAAEGVPIVSLYPGVLYGPGLLTKGNSLAELVCVHLLPRCRVGHGTYGHNIRCVLLSFC